MDNQLIDHSGDRKYRIEIPHLVWASVRDPYELSLWVTVKMIAGESGSCFMSTTNLARAAKMSRGKVSECRRRLIEANLLEGGIMNDPQGKGQGVWRLVVPDLWKENVVWREAHHSMESRLTYSERVHHMNPSPDEPKSSPHERKCSPGEPKKNLLRINHKEVDDDSAAEIFSTALDNYLIKPSEIGKQMVADALDTYGSEQVMVAMKEAVAHNARSWRYVEKVLDGAGRSKDGGPVMDDDWREANEEKIDAMLAKRTG